MECPDYEIINWRSTGIGNVIAELCKKDGIKTIGFEQDHLTFATWRSMQDTIDAELVPTLNVVERFREVKTPEEIQKLRVSCDIASRAFDKILQDIKVGVTEKELASRLSHYMVMEGADTKPES